MDPADLEDLLAAQAKLLVPLALLGDILALIVLLAELALIPAVLDITQQLQPQLYQVLAPRKSVP